MALSFPPLLPYLTNCDPSGMRVLVRLDLDLSFDGKKFDTTRLERCLESVAFLWEHKAQHVTVIGHRGNEPTTDPKWSLTPIADLLYELLLKHPTFKKTKRDAVQAWLDVLENLRFDPREKEGSVSFAKELAKEQDLYVFDAFATSHREHTSVVVLPTLLPTVLGRQCEDEIRIVKKVLVQPKRPFVLLMGGAKLETKLPLIENMAGVADVILVGGKLAKEARDKGIKHRRMIVAELTEDGLDIAPASAEQFSRFLVEAKTLVWNGPMGYFEDGKHDVGTKFVANIIAQKQGSFVLVGGGDTEAALTQLKLDKAKGITFISSGGGALLHLLAHRTLPLFDALKSSSHLAQISVD
jgi:phosphoglycerate kinase